ncbi:hypothetical protein HDR63_02865 [bacterium]|nr:hypothetical protein [bacterium]
MLFGKRIFDKRLWVRLGKTAVVSVGLAAVVSVAAATISPFGAAGIVAGTALIAPFEYWFHFKRGQTHELALETGADTFDRVCGVICHGLGHLKRHERALTDYVQNVRQTCAHAWRENYAPAPAMRWAYAGMCR